MPDDLMQASELSAHQSSGNDCQLTAVHHSETISLQALLAQSGPSSNISLCNSISSLASDSVGSMASMGLGINRVNSPLSHNHSCPSYTITLNKLSAATSSHLVGAGDVLPGMNFSLSTSVGCNPIINMKHLVPNQNTVIGSFQGMQSGVNMQHNHSNQMMNGPNFHSGIGHSRPIVSMVANAPPVHSVPHTMLNNSQMLQMAGHQNLSHMMKAQQGHPQAHKVS